MKDMFFSEIFLKKICCVCIFSGLERVLMLFVLSETREKHFFAYNIFGFRIPTSLGDKIVIFLSFFCWGLEFSEDFLGVPQEAGWAGAKS